MPSVKLIAQVGDSGVIAPARQWITAFVAEQRPTCTPFLGYHVGAQFRDVFEALDRSHETGLLDHAAAGGDTDLLNEEHVSLCDQLSEVRFPSGISLLVNIPGGQTDRAWVERTVVSGRRTGGFVAAHPLFCDVAAALENEGVLALGHDDATGESGGEPDDYKARNATYGYFVAFATSASSGFAFGFRTVLRIRMSGGSRLLPP